MVTGGETDINVEFATEGGPDSGGELRSSIGDNIIGEAIETEDVVAQNLGCLKDSG